MNQSAKSTRKRALVALASLVLLSGCGIFGTDSDSEASESAENNENESVHLTPLERYAELVTDVMDDSNDLLNTYSGLIDMMYSEEANTNHFVAVVNDLLPESNEIITRLDNMIYDLNEELYDYHSDLIALKNYQHQMLLTSLAMANDEDEDIDLEDLRERYVTVKQDQTTLISRIKTIFANTEIADDAS